MSGLGWMALAQCKGMPLAPFYPERGGSTAAARKACAACQVRAQCEEYALEHDEKWGIWGGVSEAERVKERRKRGRRGQRGDGEQVVA